MSDALLAEFRHRYNQRCSERRRTDCPRPGFYDSWLIDKLQALVERNHGKPLYPGWTSASDYKDTPESFGTVPIYSQELHNAIEAQREKLGTEAVAEMKKKLTPDQQYMCTQTRSWLPFLPLNGKAEFQLFQKLRSNQGSFDAEEMAIKWCEHVDGVSIFPKLPVYLRTHHDKWERNQRIQVAVQGHASQQAALDTVNAQTEATMHDADEEAAVMLDADDGAAADQGSANGLGALHPPLSQPLAQHPPMPVPMGPAPLLPYVVAGLSMGISNPPVQTSALKRPGGRPKGSANKKARLAPTCKKCHKKWPACPGGTPRGVCGSV